MKEKHGIGFYCEQCDEYCLFEEELEEHMEIHVTEIECVECNEKFECVECNEKFESVDKVIEHENEGECDQCGKWLGCGTNLGKHKKREHEITSEEGSKEEENKRDSSEDKEKGEDKDDRVNGDDEGENFESNDEEDDED